MDKLVAAVIFVHVLISILLMVLVLLHSGRDSGLGSIGGAAGGGGGGGQYVMERNLDRLTVLVAIVYVGTTIALAHLFEG